MKVLNSFNLRSLHLIHLLPLLCHEVAANTEIINFSSSRVPTVDLPLDVLGNWSTLRPTENERRWSLEPAVLHTPLHQVCERTDASSHAPFSFSCPHALWLLLDLDDEQWASRSTFTLRVSWPASTPADVAMALYTPEELRAWFSQRGLGPNSGVSTPRAPTTRTRYARICAVHAGVATPGSPGRSMPPAPSSPLLARAADALSGVVVPLEVVLEPTYWGVLPATLVPTVGFLFLVVLGAAAFVPVVLAYLEPYARQARMDTLRKAGARP